MGAVIATKMAALVAVLFAVLLTHGARAQPESNTTPPLLAAATSAATEAGSPLRPPGTAHPMAPAPSTTVCANAVVRVNFLVLRCGNTNHYPFDSSGGACGFKNTNQYPFMSMTSCGNEPLFKDGNGCGACYQVRHVVDTRT
jgi:hypothetical protein